MAPLPTTTWIVRPCTPRRCAALWSCPARCGPRSTVVEESRSTNADLVDAGPRDAAAGVVLVAEHQTAGRGRLDRTWTAPAPGRSDAVGAGATGSGRGGAMAVAAAAGRAGGRGRGAARGRRARRSEVAQRRRRRRPQAGRAARRTSRVRRWFAGAVIGIGLNVSTDRAELPVAERDVAALSKGADDGPHAAPQGDPPQSRWTAAPAGSAPEATRRRACTRPTVRRVRRSAATSRFSCRTGRTHTGRASDDRRARPAGGATPRRADRVFGAGDVVHVRADDVTRSDHHTSPGARHAGGPMAISPKLLGEGEHVIVSTREHWKAIIMPGRRAHPHVRGDGLRARDRPGRRAPTTILMWLVLRGAVVVLVWFVVQAAHRCGSARRTP